jgi:uncharacterized protein (DUF2147 family)
MRLRLILSSVLLVLLTGLVTAPTVFASPSPVGMWWTQDRRGVIAIAPCLEGLCGRIVGQDIITDSAGRPGVDTKGAPTCGLIILRGTEPADSDRWQGIITDPETGSDWHVLFWIGPDGNLRLRGYIFFQWLGETQLWPRFVGTVSPDCAIHPPP